jgi:arabinogalactan endo-1,4-beta-galactosidase
MNSRFATMLFVFSLAFGTVTAQLPKGFLRGGDVSEIAQVEDAGGKYFLDGKQMDPFALLKKEGWNFVRFRVWNHPREGYCDKDHTLALARRAAKLGFKISIDFHYSDWWADPGKQPKPAAWQGLSFVDLTKAVHDFTKDVVSALVQQGTSPYMVQVGNEITGGMIWPDGRVNSDNPRQWANLSALVQAGIDGVHDAQGRKKILTMIHLDRGGDNKGAIWWFDHLAKQNVKFDTIGLSYYPLWHGHLAQLEANLDDLANRYHKDVYVVETGYPWTTDVSEGGNRNFSNPDKLEAGYAATPMGVAQFLTKVEQIIADVPQGHGKGLLYWAPMWISGPKQRSGWGNLALFDFKGNALPGVAAIGGKLN